MEKVGVEELGYGVVESGPLVRFPTTLMSNQPAILQSFQKQKLNPQTNIICLIPNTCEVSCQKRNGHSAQLLSSELGFTPSVTAQEIESIKDPIVWDLTSIYPSVEAWETALEEVNSGIGQLSTFEGTWAKARSLATALKAQSDLLFELVHIWVLPPIPTKTFVNQSLKAGVRWL